MYITGCLIFGSFGRSGRIYVDARNILHGVLVQVACPCTVSSLGTGIEMYMHVLPTATIWQYSAPIVCLAIILVCVCNKLIFIVNKEPL